MGDGAAVCVGNAVWTEPAADREAEALTGDSTPETTATGSMLSTDRPELVPAGAGRTVALVALASAGDLLARNAVPDIADGLDAEFDERADRAFGPGLVASPDTDADPVLDVSAAAMPTACVPATDNPTAHAANPTRAPDVNIDMTPRFLPE